MVQKDVHMYGVSVGLVPDLSACRRLSGWLSPAAARVAKWWEVRVLAALPAKRCLSATTLCATSLVENRSKMQIQGALPCDRVHYYFFISQGCTASRCGGAGDCWCPGLCPGP